MKILIFPILFVFFLSASYLFIKKPKNKKQKNNPPREIWLISAMFIAVVFAFLGYKFLNSINTPDTWCIKAHSTTSLAPKSLISSNDYFDLGNYDYDIGNCKQAIIDYSKSIELNPGFPQSYNNRAYTYMRMQDYKDALPDLDQAIELNPNYIKALMNRGDIHNYYFAIDRKSAIADYEKAISLGAGNETSVCGHLFLAKHNGWNLGTIWDFLSGARWSCN